MVVMFSCVIVFIICLAVLIWIVWEFEEEKERELYRRRIEKRNQLDRLQSNEKECSPQEFFELRKGSKDFEGVYIIHNITKDKYYVGQSVHVLQRVNKHMTGYGNGDVYADYKYGDRFTIKCLSLEKSGYSSLDRLEKDFIERHDAKEHGYNRRKGNG